MIKVSWARQALAEMTIMASNVRVKLVKGLIFI